MSKPVTPQERYADEEVVAVKCYKGPHRAKLVTRDTKKFVQWISMHDYRRIKLMEITHEQ